MIAPQAEGAPATPAQHPAAHAQAAGGVPVEQPGRRRVHHGSSCTEDSCMKLVLMPEQYMMLVTP